MNYFMYVFWVLGMPGQLFWGNMRAFSSRWLYYSLERDKYFSIMEYTELKEKKYTGLNDSFIVLPGKRNFTQTWSHYLIVILNVFIFWFIKWNLQ